MCPAVRLASYSPCEKRTRLAIPMPLRLTIGLEKTGKDGGGTPGPRCDCDLVIDPAMVGIPKPGVAVFGWNIHVRRAGDALEILQAPGVGFADRHARSFDWKIVLTIWHR